MPLVLIAPVVWPLRRRIRDLLVIGIAATVVAGPWYAAMTARFGRLFLDDFIWKHHFQRFATDALQHVRPWWFYLPVLLGAILPWTPVLAVVRSDRRTAFLWCWVGYTVLFFSASRNKLPGYILPVVPILAHSLGNSLGAGEKCAVCARRKWLSRSRFTRCRVRFAGGPQAWAQPGSHHASLVDLGGRGRCCRVRLADPGPGLGRPRRGRSGNWVRFVLEGDRRSGTGPPSVGPTRLDKTNPILSTGRSRS